jgi:hypothetical protein
MLPPAVAASVRSRLHVSRTRSRRSRLHMLAPEPPRELGHRLARDRLDRHAVAAECERDRLRPGTVGEQQASLRAEQRNVDAGRWARSPRQPRWHTTTLSQSESRPSTKPGPRPSSVCSRTPARQTLGRRIAGVDPAAAARLRRGVLSRQFRLQPVLAAAAARDELLSRRPERVEDDRAEPKGALGFDDEPAAPTDDRRDVVRRCHEGGALRQYLLRLARRLGRLFRSGDSFGSSRGTGASSGSIVCMRRGSPMSMPLISSVRPFRRRLPPRASRALLSA